MLSAEYKQFRKEDVKDLHNIELIKACKENKALLGEFLRENRDFVFSIIMHFKGNIEELCTKFRITEEELLQHAYIGILIALNDFDFQKGYKFTTFVVRPILWEINQLLYSDSQPVRLSRGAVDLIKQMVEIEGTLGYRPNEEEMARLLNITIERVREISRFTSDLKYYDGMENFDIVDKPEHNFEESIHNKVYVQQLLEDAIFTEFEKNIMYLIMKGLNNTQIASHLDVYPMTINRTLVQIKNKIKNQELNSSTDGRNKIVSKYEQEIHIIAEDMKERNEVMSIEEIVELLDVCGYDINQYTTRILYYIRQKALHKT